MTWSREDALAMERRHVIEGEDRYHRQEALIARLRKHGLDTAEAEKLLAGFAEFLELARTGVQRLEEPNPNLGPVS